MSSAVSHLDLTMSPRRHFHSADAVVSHDGLTRDEKRLILEAWAQELANEIHHREHMPAPAYDEDPEPQELRGVRRALAGLRAGDRPVA